MRKNEPSAVLRVAGPIPFVDADGKLKKNLSFAHGSGEVFYYNSGTNAWVAAANDAVELGGANTTGIYYVQMAQAETNFDSIVGIKLVKATYDDQFWFATIDNTPDVNVVTIAQAGINSIWDEPLTAATHNVGASAGKRLRQLAGFSLYDGTAQSGGTNYIQLDAGASGTDDLFHRCIIAITGGTGAGQARTILRYLGSTTKRAYVNHNWVTQPDNTSTFSIYSASVAQASEGLAQAGAAGSITLQSTEPATDDYFKGVLVSIASGTGQGQTRYVTGYTGSTRVATVSPNWATTPDATSIYVIPRWDAQLIRSDIAAIPSAATIRDAVLDAARSGHIVVGSIGEGIALATSLLQGNFFIDNVDNTDPNGPTAQRLRCWLSAAAMAGVTAGGTGQGEFATFLVTTTYEGPNKIVTHKVVQQ